MSIPKIVGSKAMCVGDVVTPNDYPLTFDEVTPVTAILACNHIERFWTLGTYNKYTKHYCVMCWKDVEFASIVVSEDPFETDLALHDVETDQTKTIWANQSAWKEKPAWLKQGSKSEEL